MRLSMHNDMETNIGREIFRPVTPDTVLMEPSSSLTALSLAFMRQYEIFTAAVHEQGTIDHEHAGSAVYA